MAEIHDRLRQAREAAGFETATDAARRFGWASATYLGHENGSRGVPRQKIMIYAQAFRVAPEWLLTGAGDGRKAGVPVVGYVGAGAEVWPVDDGGQLDEIEAPPGIGRDAVAVVVRGDSMWPRYSDGDVIVYDCHIPLSAAMNRECVVGLQDGRRMVKIVRPAGDAVQLESHNAPPIRDAAVEWVAPIVWIKRA